MRSAPRRAARQGLRAHGRCSPATAPSSRSVPGQVAAALRVAARSKLITAASASPLADRRWIARDATDRDAAATRAP